MRAAVRELLRDEVDHARLGWAHLASPRMSDATRRAVAVEIRPLLELCRSLWLNERRVDTQLPKGHGCAPLLDLPHIVDDAVNELILPGLRHVGIIAP